MRGEKFIKFPKVSEEIISASSKIAKSLRCGEIILVDPKMQKFVSCRVREFGKFCNWKVEINYRVTKFKIARSLDVARTKSLFSR